MSRTIVFAAAAVPGAGGGNTAAYHLFERMQRDGWTVAYINIIDAQDVEYFYYVFGEHYGNPKGLAHVHNCVLSRPPFYPSAWHEELVELLRELQPDLCLGAGYDAVLLLRAALPATPVIFLVAGCNTVKTLLEKTVNRPFTELALWLQTRNHPPPPLHDRELAAVRSADLVITHATMIKQLYEHFFPEYRGKILSEIIWFAEWIYQDARAHAQAGKPFAERDIDVLFVAERWQRHEKNLPLLNRLLRGDPELCIHVVGEMPKPLQNATCHGLIPDRAELFALLGRAKTVACPSLFDAAPGILYEASALGCNVVASKNCGNWRLCHPDLLVEPFDLALFQEKLRLSVTRPFADNIDFFLRTDSYRNLLDTLEVMASWTMSPR